MKKIGMTVLGAALLVLGAVSDCFAAPSGVVSTLAERSGISKDEASKQVDAVFSAVSTELDSGHEVTIRNFGRFYVQDRAERTARNPKTGAQIQVPARKYARFVSSDGMKKELNDSESVDEEASEEVSVKPIADKQVKVDGEASKGKAKNPKSKKKSTATQS